VHDRLLFVMSGTKCKNIILLALSSENKSCKTLAEGLMVCLKEPVIPCRPGIDILNQAVLRGLQLFFKFMISICCIRTSH